MLSRAWSGEGGAAGLIWREAGIGDGLASRLIARLWDDGACSGVDSEWSALCTDPYRLVGQVEGYGWPQAEQVATLAGIRPESELRNAGLILHLVRRACWEGGHSHVTRRWIEAAYAASGGRAPFQLAMSRAAEWEQALVVRGERVYPALLDVAEERFAGALRSLCNPSRPLWPGSHLGLEERIQQAEAAIGIALDPGQRKALIGLMTSSVRLHTLSGGPGCGKTTVMELLAALVAQALFAASTGKAAMLLTSRVRRHGKRAVTVHSLLPAGLQPGTTQRKGLGRPSASSIDADLLVIDEASMQDLDSMSQLLARVGPHSHVLLVGDPEQLPSVGPGQVLRDALAVRNGNHERLQVGHRARGGLPTFLDAVRTGRIDWAALPSEVVHVAPADDGEPSLQDALAVWSERARVAPLQDIALLLAYRKASTGVLNTETANRILQSQWNPPTARNYIAGSNLRLGDRVIVRKNLRLQGEAVANGDTGELTAWSPGRLRIKLDDGRLVTLEGGQAQAVELAYGQTIHSAQGTTANDVIVALESGSDFVTRSLLYTACSRARARLWLVGRRSTFEGALQTMPAARASSVLDRIQLAESAMPASASLY